MKINQRICRSLDVFARQKRGMTECGGRSMVEMLGVLAIVGILSAGALAGYSKAMFRHKMNQTIDIFQGVLQRFAELEQKGLGENVGIDGAPDLIKYGFLSNCQATENNECKLPMGTLGMGFEDRGSRIFGEFFISFTDSKSCIAFASAGWENAVPQEWWLSHPAMPNGGGSIEVCGSSGGSCQMIYNLYSDLGDIVTTVTMQNITEACQVCDSDGGCFWQLTVRAEL